ncbi:MAG: hypothetical protein E7293_01765 [Lachnospiraceae bacterium]|nr:hypothetical protein [Lachnospiraceae bacterium]
MKKTVFYNPEIPYSLHDMNVISLEVKGDNLIMRTQSGMVRTAPNWDQVNGYVEFLDVSWEYCYATVCAGYYGNIGSYEGKTFKKMYLKDFIGEFQNAGFYITDEYYGQDRALYTGYFHKGGTMSECIIEIYHHNIVFFEQNDDTREMKEVILSADGDLSLYLVPADVADNLAMVANEFAFNYVWHGKKSGKFLKLCGEQYGAVFDEEDFIEYLNTVLYPEKPSRKIKTLCSFDDKVPEKYARVPYYNF